MVECDDGERQAIELDHVAFLGSGGDSSVSSYRFGGQVVAEKTFRGSGLSSLISKGFNIFSFQVANPYRRNYHASRTAFHRRNALALLSEFWFGEQMVAKAVYTRFDEEADSYVLAAEFVDGRGYEHKDNDAIRLLWDFTRRMHESGFTGSTWQVNPRMAVTTANIRISKDGRPVLIDLESAMPAVHLFVPGLFAKGIKSGNFPLFDDVDYGRLWDYIDENSEIIREKLGDEKANGLVRHLERMEDHELLWKMS